MLGEKPLKLNKELSYALDQMEQARHPIFISGKAGTGKSTLLKLFMSTSRKRIAVVAPTGVAALNVKGQTIHSFFRFPPRLIMPSDIRRVRNHRLYENLEVLVIDEISMVRADQFDNMDVFLRLNRKNAQPFGGVKLVLIGDLFQLPPVVSTAFEKAYIDQEYGSPYFFSSSAYKTIEHQVEYIELSTVYRQSQSHFIRLLDAIRRNAADEEDLYELNKRVAGDDMRHPGSITLTTRNDKVRQINQLALSSLPDESKSYAGLVSGNFDPRIFPTALNLVLKKGAQVMLLRNDPDKRYVNGSIGTISYLDEYEVRVYLDDDENGQDVNVGRYTWEMIRYDWKTKEKSLHTEVIGTYTQYPLKLAWAVTIHKSQGQSFDHVYLDMGRGAFESGQSYVALSRCTTLEGLQLRKPLQPSDILVDPRIVEFYAQWR